MPYSFYKVLHVISIVALFFSFGAALFAQMQNPGVKKYAGRKAVFILHGISVFLVILAGFGLAARTGTPVSTPWIVVKIVIALFFGGAISLIHRSKAFLKVGPYILIGLALAAIYLAVNKPIF